MVSVQVEHIGQHVSVLIGDNRETMREISDKSVQCVVTSPPYYGLRDYKVDGQIGLEPTPDEYVAALVGVFREVRRVLRDDGTVWLNLGLSYASGDTRPSLSPLLQRVPACDSGDKESQDYQATDCVCYDPDDEHQAGIQSHRGCTAYNDQHAGQDVQLPLQTSHDNEHLGCETELLCASLHDVQESTIQQSSCQSQGVFDLEAKASVSLRSPDSSLFDAQESDDKSAYTCDTFQMSQPLVVHTKGKESFFSACNRSDCKGIGRCGYCWVSLAITSLNVKAKDELNIPHLVAMALQADGWVLRQTIIWHKPNPMPESVTDRNTKAHEYLFLLSKSARYFYDAEAVKEDSAKEWNSVKGFGGAEKKKSYGQPKMATHGAGSYHDDKEQSGRNRRSVWTVATQPYSGAHFATFPPKLIEPCILAGTPERGCCPHCGAPWERVVENVPGHATTIKDRRASKCEREKGGGMERGYETSNVGAAQKITTGHQPTCACPDHEPVPSTVLDPFGGSGTTAAVALEHGRKAILCELSPEYVGLMRERIGMLTDAIRQGRLL